MTIVIDFFFFLGNQVVASTLCPKMGNRGKGTHFPGEEMAWLEEWADNVWAQLSLHRCHLL